MVKRHKPRTRTKVEILHLRRDSPRGGSWKGWHKFTHGLGKVFNTVAPLIQSAAASSPEGSALNKLASVTGKIADTSKAFGFSPTSGASMSAGPRTSNMSAQSVAKTVAAAAPAMNNHQSGMGGRSRSRSRVRTPRRYRRTR